MDEKKTIWRITNFDSVDDYYFCTLNCCDSFLEERDETEYTDPEELNDVEELAELRAEENNKCDFCRHPY